MFIDAPELEKEIKEVFNANDNIIRKKAPKKPKSTGKRKLTVGSDEWLDFINELTGEFKNLNTGLDKLNESLTSEIHKPEVLTLKPELVGLLSSCASVIATVKKRDSIRSAIKSEFDLYIGHAKFLKELINDIDLIHHILTNNKKISSLLIRINSL